MKKKQLLHYLLSYLYVEVLVIILLILCCVFTQNWGLFIVCAWCQIPMPIVVGVFTMFGDVIFSNKENTYDTQN